MNFSDFEFDGKRLSHFDCIVGGIGNKIETTVPSHTPITLNTFRQYGSNINQLAKRSYEEATTIDINIIKDNCKGISYFLDDEFKKIVNWLETDTYKNLKVFYDDGSFNDVMFYAMCTEMSTIRSSDGIAGLQIKFTLNAPFGFSDMIVIKKSLSSNGSFDVAPDSDEIGILLPTHIKIELKEDPPIGSLGDTEFIFQNILDNDYFELDGCITNEVIELDCKNKLISSKRKSGDIYVKRENLHNYFNFFYPRLIVKREGNGNNDVITNVFTVNTACDIEFSYQNVRKVGVLI